MNSYPLPSLTQSTHTDERRSGDRPTDLRSRYIHDFLASRHLAPNTRKAYTKELNRFLTWSNLPLPEIGTKQIVQFKQYLEAERHLKPASINRAIAAIASFYNWLIQAYPSQYSQNPTQAIDFASVPVPIARDLSESEVMRLWHVVTNSNASDSVQLRNAALLSILSHGLRASEVAGLTVGDFDGKRLYVRVAKDDSTGTVPLNGQAREHITNYLNWREKQFQKLADSSPLLLSCSNRNQGEALSYEGIYKIVAAWGIKAEIPNLHPHRLRHTYATKLLLLGMDSYLARSLTRHQSEASFNRYAKRARSIAAEKAFYQAIGEEND
ncbi:tyrosine-type recombinase/integrase [Pseudanabaena sp. PCC 6802]|uniref:tyrosine-type recombinase/integrase n=1 Tax=Pseudanabaena sp. PCC 6802 TaxID=118173 RepID=UPI00035C1D9B|nr:tyrosine-type recombinase/integrase [Pseudanabaena sp. PCC 6802]